MLLKTLDVKILHFIYMPCEGCERETEGEVVVEYNSAD